MGVQDTSTKDYLSDADVFADAVNYYLYGGERVVKPDTLKPLDSNLLLHVFGHEGGNAKRPYRGREETAERYRDAARQVDEIRVRHSMEGRPESSKEFLSGMHKGDHLIPVITICIHFGTEPWDGALSLKELFHLQDERLLPYIQDYRVFLIEPSQMKEGDFEKFSTTLGQVLRFMKAASDKKEMAKLMRDESAYGGLNRKAARVIRDCAYVDVKTNEGEEINMCKAWEDAMEDAANAARLEEREASQEREKELCKAWEDAMEAARLEEREASQGREKCSAIRASIDAFREFGISGEDIRQRIMNKYALSEQEADRYM